MATSNEVRALRAKVRGFQAEGITIHQKIKSSSGKERQQRWIDKRELGKSSRSHLIAYGLLRWRAFNRIEQKVSEANRPDVVSLAGVLSQHCDSYEKNLFKDFQQIYPVSNAQHVTAILTNSPESDNHIKALIQAHKSSEAATNGSVISILELNNLHIKDSPIMSTLKTKISEYIQRNNVEMPKPKSYLGTKTSDMFWSVNEPT